MRVLLLEDETFMAEHIEHSLIALVPDLEVVRTSRADEALTLALEQAYDCLLFDRLVEAGDGVETLAALRRQGIETPAIIISNLGDIEHRVSGLENGADDYVSKGCEPVELLARIRAAVRRGSTQGHPRILKMGSLELHRAAEVAEWDGHNLKLKPKEFRLLLCIVSNHPEPASYGTIWREAWPNFARLPPQRQPIQTTMSRLREALRAAPGIAISSTPAGYVVTIAAGPTMV